MGVSSSSCVLFSHHTFSTGSSASMWLVVVQAAQFATAVVVSTVAVHRLSAVDLAESMAAMSWLCGCLCGSMLRAVYDIMLNARHMPGCPTVPSGNRGSAR